MDKKSGKKEEQQHILLEKIIGLIPPHEQLELMQKVEFFTAQMNLFPPTPSGKKAKSKKKKYESSSQESGGDSLDDTTNNQSKFNSTSSQRKKESKKKSRMSSIKEEDEEKDGKIGKDKASNKLCGKKRKNGDQIEYITRKQKKNKNDEEDNSVVSHNLLIKGKKCMSDKKILLELVKREGFARVFNCLTIHPLNRKKQLERIMDDIIINLGLLRTSLILFQIKFQFIDGINMEFNSNLYANDENSHSSLNKSDDEEDEDIEILIDGHEGEEKGAKRKKKNSVLTPSKQNKIQTLKNNAVKDSPLTRSKSEEKEDKEEKENKEDKEDKEEKDDKDDKDDKEDKEDKEEKYDKEEKEEKEPDMNINHLNQLKNLNLNTPSTDLGDLSIHLHKDEEGNIYKYNKKYLCGNNIVAFYCSDKKCCGKGNYNTETMKFEILKEHDLTFEEHNYVKNKERGERFKLIISEFQKRNCHEAQLFKGENGSQVAKWYD